MRALKICRRHKECFTVVAFMFDFSSFPYDGTFPREYRYYRIDTEEELVTLLLKEEDLLAEEIETIYFGDTDITEKYLKFNNEISGYQLLDSWKC